MGSSLVLYNYLQPLGHNVRAVILLLNTQRILAICLGAKKCIIIWKIRV